MDVRVTADRREGLRVLSIVCFSCLAMLGEGYDLQAPGVTLPVMTQAFALSSGDGLLSGLLSEKSLFLSMSTFGLILGSPLCGWLADLHGRKWVAVGSIIAFSIFSIATAHATSTEILLACRLLTGIGMGGAMSALMASVAETVGPARRSAAVGLLYASAPAGGVIASLVSIAFANPAQWPMIYYVGGLLPITGALGLIAVLKDAVPSGYRSGQGASQDRSALFRDGRLMPTLALWAAFICVMFSGYVLLGWLPSILLSKSLPSHDVFVVQTGFSASGIAGSVLTGLLRDRLGRSTSIALVFTMAAGMLLGLALSPPSLVILFALAAGAGFAVTGSAMILYALALDCYPMSMRGTGVGFALGLGRMGSAVGPLVAGALLAVGLSSGLVLAAVAPLILMGGAAAMFVNARVEKAGGASRP